MSCINESFIVEFLNNSNEDNEVVEEQNCLRNNTAKKGDNEAIDRNVVQAKTTSVRATVEAGLASGSAAAKYFR